MTRQTSYGLSPAPDRIKITESVLGVGPEPHDALQSLLDNMELRCARLREELTRRREGRL